VAQVHTFAPSPTAPITARPPRSTCGDTSDLTSGDGFKPPLSAVTHGNTTTVAVINSTADRGS
jgi:hypothetical protein